MSGFIAFIKEHYFEWQKPHALCGWRRVLCRELRIWIFHSFWFMAPAFFTFVLRNWFMTFRITTPRFFIFVSELPFCYFLILQLRLFICILQRFISERHESISPCALSCCLTFCFLYIMIIDKEHSRFGEWQLGNTYRAYLFRLLQVLLP